MEIDRDPPVVEEPEIMTDSDKRLIDEIGRLGIDNMLKMMVVLHGDRVGGYTIKDITAADVIDARVIYGLGNEGWPR